MKVPDTQKKSFTHIMVSLSCLPATLKISLNVRDAQRLSIKRKFRSIWRQMGSRVGTPVP